MEALTDKNADGDGAELGDAPLVWMIPAREEFIAQRASERASRAASIAQTHLETAILWRRNEVGPASTKASYNEGMNMEALTDKNADGDGAELGDAPLVWMIPAREEFIAQRASERASRAASIAQTHLETAILWRRNEVGPASTKASQLRAAAARDLRRRGLDAAASLTPEDNQFSSTPEKDQNP